MTNIELISKLSELPHDWEVWIRLDGVVESVDVIKMGRIADAEPGMNPQIILQGEHE